MKAGARTGSILRRALFRTLGVLCLFGGMLGFVLGDTAPGADSTARAPAILLEIDGPIGPATDDYIRRSLNEAVEREAPVVVIRVDTPGGLDTSMRSIISRILESSVPIAVYVAPEGARAASAGTYILYAAHVAAMAPATSVGAATPVQIGGAPGGLPSEREEDEEEGETEAEPHNAMERKIVNDAVAYIRGLAELRARNADWAEEAVRQGVSVTSSEALELGVIDFRVQDLDALLGEMEGRTVQVRREDHVLSTQGLEVEAIEPDWRARLLAVLSNPNVAYILMLLGIYGLIMEFANPGTLIPGIAGAISLLIGLFALHLLPINYAGLALIFLGMALMVAEAFAPSFGALGIGGAIAFILGSIILFDTDFPGFELHLSVIISFAAVSAVVFIFVLAMALKAWRRPVVSGRESLTGRAATALSDFDDEGRVSVFGESWKARATAPVRKGERVRVTAVEGLVLTVKPEKETEEEK